MMRVGGFHSMHQEVIVTFAVFVHPITSFKMENMLCHVHTYVRMYVCMYVRTSLQHHTGPFTVH